MNLDQILNNINKWYNKLPKNKKNICIIILFLLLIIISIIFVSNTKIEAQRKELEKKSIEAELAKFEQENMSSKNIQKEECSYNYNLSISNHPFTLLYIFGGFTLNIHNNIGSKIDIFSEIDGGNNLGINCFVKIVYKDGEKNTYEKRYNITSPISPGETGSIYIEGISGPNIQKIDNIIGTLYCENTNYNNLQCTSKSPIGKFSVEKGDQLSGMKIAFIDFSNASNTPNYFNQGTNKKIVVNLRSSLQKEFDNTEFKSILHQGGALKINSNATYIIYNKKYINNSGVISYIQSIIETEVEKLQNNEGLIFPKNIEIIEMSEDIENIFNKIFAGKNINYCDTDNSFSKLNNLYYNCLSKNFITSEENQGLDFWILMTK